MYDLYPLKDTYCTCIGTSYLGAHVAFIFEDGQN